jgi:glycosyltransferase involved in cell wall biosynthesis
MNQHKVAWLLPAMGTGGISFQHILSEFVKEFPETVVFTGQWPGFAAGFENTFTVQEVGETKHIQIGSATGGYRSSISFMSPSIIGHLLKFRPDVIFANAFSMWTMIALLLKPLGRWKVIVICEGVSPSIDYRSSPLRLYSRRIVARLADSFVVNGRAAKAYLVDVLGAREDRIFSRPFLLPSLKAMLQCPGDAAMKIDPDLQRPIFLFVGQIVPRKGLKVLLEACSILKTQGSENYSLLIVGDGEQRQELEDFAKSEGIDDRVKWVGRVEYRCLGQYFQAADVFVFPTYEDIWGMVLTEAMAFGKPVICSQGAGSVEMVDPEANGFVFHPQQPDEIARYMQKFIDDPHRIATMGLKAQEMMYWSKPELAVDCFYQALKLGSSFGNSQ